MGPTPFEKPVTKPCTIWFSKRKKKKILPHAPDFGAWNRLADPLPGGGRRPK
jgi:hypothetical protein